MRTMRTIARYIGGGAARMVAAVAAVGLLDALLRQSARPRHAAPASRRMKAARVGEWALAFVLLTLGWVAVIMRAV